MIISEMLVIINASEDFRFLYLTETTKEIAKRAAKAANKIYLTKSETLLVEKQMDLKRNFDTGGLPLGKYVIALELVYPGGVAPSSAHFEVIEKPPISIIGRIIIFLIILILIILIIIIILLIIRKLKEKKKEKESTAETS